MKFKSIIKKELLFLSLFLLSFFPIYPYAVVSIVTILFVVLNLTSFIWNKNKLNFKENRKKIIIYTGFYIFLIVSLLYSSDTKEGVKLISRMVPFLLFPIITFVFTDRELDRKQVSLIAKGFIFSLFVVLVYMYGHAIWIQINENSFFYNNLKLVCKRSSFLDLHPTYASISFAMGIAILLDFYTKTIKKQTKIALVGAIVLLLTSIVLLSSRIVIFCLPFLFLIYFKGVKKKIILVISFILALIVLINIVTPLENQFNDIFESNFELPKEKFPTSVQTRLAIFNCSYDIIAENTVLGVGIGSFKEELLSCYVGLNTDSLFKQKYNSHNVYFFLWGSGGIVCVFAFIYFLIYRTGIAIKSKNKILLSFIILIAIPGVTENLLVRSYGITFFILFSTFLSMKEPLTNKEN